MTRRTLTDEERIASIREVIEAARGDWHEATALRSIGADLNWLLDRALVREDAPSREGLDAVVAAVVADLGQSDGLHQYDRGIHRMPGCAACSLRARLAAALAATPPGDREDEGAETRDARRYWRLRVLGAAPYGSQNLDDGTVLCFTNLDAFVDADIAGHPSRGEAELAAVTTAEAAPE